jgi:hypothetical protein
MDENNLLPPPQPAARIERFQFEIMTEYTSTNIWQARPAQQKNFLVCIVLMQSIGY